MNFNPYSKAVLPHEYLDKIYPCDYQEPEKKVFIPDNTHLSRQRNKTSPLAHTLVHNEVMMLSPDGQQWYQWICGGIRAIDMVYLGMGSKKQTICRNEVKNLIKKVNQ